MHILQQLPDWHFSIGSHFLSQMALTMLLGYYDYCCCHLPGSSLLLFRLLQVCFNILAWNLEGGRNVEWDTGRDETKTQQVTLIAMKWESIIVYRSPNPPLQGQQSGQHYPVPVDLCQRWFGCLQITYIVEEPYHFISWQVWIFDGPTGEGRLLRFRMGHSAPLTKIRYYGQNGQQILSASEFLCILDSSKYWEQGA